MAVQLLFCWLVVWLLRHFNLCRLFNTKSIFMKIVLFQTIQLSKTFLFQAILFGQTIQFSISYAVSSIKPIDRALSGATTPGQSGPGSNGNKGVLRIPQSTSITGTSPSDCVVSYTGLSLGGES